MLAALLMVVGVAHANTEQACTNLFQPQAATQINSVASKFSSIPHRFHGIPWLPMRSVRWERTLFKDRRGWLTGFVKVGHGRELYVEYRPAKNGKQTLVFLNGLTHSAKSWDSTVAALSDPDLGIVQYDQTGQGATLQEIQLWPWEPITLDDQQEDLKNLLAALELQKVNIVGLSYGGGHGIYFANRHPELVQNLIAVAPFTERLPDQDAIIRKCVSGYLTLSPALSAYAEQLYDVCLGQLVLGTYPIAEPDILEFPEKIYGAYQMVREMKNFVAAQNVANLPVDSVHLVTGGADQYIPHELFRRFWDSVSPASRGSWLNIDWVEHKVNTTQPRMLARWIEHILENGSQVRGGLEFAGSVREGVARSGDVVIDLH